MKPVYKRILLKLSGEALMGDQGFGIDPDVVKRLAQEVVEVHKLGIEIGIVIGGGNIFRGVSGSEKGIDRVTGDHMGMLATMINCLSFQDALEKEDIPTRVLSALEIKAVAEHYIRRRAIRHLEKGRVVIFGAGTGQPYFSTDTAASLRAVEINADAIIKGTRVDGVFDSDPEKNPGAIKYDEISYLDVISKNLKIMDLTAISLCKENNLPIIVFNMNVQENLMKLVTEGNVGTSVGDY